MTKVLFVCLGNICRSPMAESIFRHKVATAGLDDAFTIESAGTGDWHVGQYPDPRTRKVLADNGIVEVSRARQVRADDFERFDHVIAMDLANERDLHAWRDSQPEKVSLMSSWHDDSKLIEVPDPYYGSHEDFEQVFSMLDAATEAMLNKLRKSQIN